MKRVYPDLPWYTRISQAKRMPPRCPYATAARCPRYFQSLSLLESVGSTSIPSEQDAKLAAFWKATDLWPVIEEQVTSVSGSSDGRKMLSKFCPEVAFLRFDLFATDLIPYHDVEESETAQQELATVPGSSMQTDYRWHWRAVHEMHYSECPLYSLLPHVPPTAKADPSSSEELLEMKPSVAGFQLNIKVLVTRLARWWLKKQRPQ